MNDLDRRLTSLRRFDIAEAPDLQALRRRRTAQRTKAVALGGAILAVGTVSVFGLFFSGDDDASVSVDTVSEDAPAAEEGLRPTDFARTATPPSVRDLSDRPACEDSQDISSVLGLVDPTGTLGGVDDPAGALVPVEDVLERVPVDADAAATAECVSAWASSGADLAATRCATRPASWCMPR